jgi:hypothetical protein
MAVTYFQYLRCCPSPKCDQGTKWLAINRKEKGSLSEKVWLELESVEIGDDLPPISQPLITGVSRFWFGFEIDS